MTSIRIVVALPHLGVYGGIRRFLELGNVWIARGHEVAIAVPDPERGGEPWVPFSGRVLSIAAARQEAWDALLSPDPALFLSTEIQGAIRVFYSVLERAPDAASAWRRADLVLANSAGMKRWLARHGVDAVDAAGGVNLRFFHPPDPDPRFAGAGAGRAVRALVYGRLSRKRKGSWAAARAIEHAARRTGIATELTLFDSPPPGAEPPALPRPLEIPHRWVLNPSQEGLASLYREADVFVSAERRAGWCNTAAEAMACGAAVACTRSGTEDFAIHQETALVARWPASWNLATCVASLLRDPNLRARLSTAGRARIEEFSWERTADRVERAIGQRLETRSHAAISK